MISGARAGSASALRRIMAHAMARALPAYVVPGPEVARAHGLDIEAAGLTLAATPRHAGVLIVVGPLSDELRTAAAVTYAQMMRPRAILAAGAGPLSPLPAADVSVALSQQPFAASVAQLRDKVARGAFAAETQGYTADVLQSRTEYTCSMHPEVAMSEPGACPQCGMDLVARETQAGSADTEESGDAGTADSDHQHGDDNGHQGQGGEDQQDNHQNQEDEDQGDDDDMDFMSMIAMTKDLPPSPDGLRMDWLEVPFGPFHPGFPGGLHLALTLDGDTVAKARADSLAPSCSPPAQALRSPATFVHWLARLDPLATHAYRELAWRALENAAGTDIEPQAAAARAAAVERERAASHASWLAEFARLIGYAWLTGRACALQSQLMQFEFDRIASLQTAVQSLAKRPRRSRLLRRRLTGIGRLPAHAEALGPVARSRGTMTDVRTDDGAYSALGFEIQIAGGGDAWGRLQVRLAEMAHSLDLIRAAGRLDPPAWAGIGDAAGGRGEASLETPRGEAKLQLSLVDGRVDEFRLQTPSATHMRLIEGLVDQRELGDALTAVASLDLSPWEVSP